jgi:hypothetical protein
MTVMCDVTPPHCLHGENTEMCSLSLNKGKNTPETEFVENIRRVDDFSQEWPTIASVLGLNDLNLSWQMDYCERATLIPVLQNFRPTISIEVGTYSGGSLAVLSRFSQKVFSLDINPLSSEYLVGRFPNVAYVIGDSKLELPRILETVEREQSGPTFVLVDGDHSAAGVLADLNNILRFQPRHPTIVMAHDSFNPDCRTGMLQARWADSPHVHLVEIDFQNGYIFEISNGQMWGGLALAVLLPEKRKGELTVSRRHELLYRTILAQSLRQQHRSWITHQAGRAMRKLRRIGAAHPLRAQ